MICIDLIKININIDDFIPFEIQFNFLKNDQLISEFFQFLKNLENLILNLYLLIKKKSFPFIEETLNNLLNTSL